MANVGAWVASIDEESWNDELEFGSREEAVEYGKVLADEYGMNHFWTGRIKAVDVRGVKTWSVLEDIGESASEEVGELAEGWPRCTEEQEKDLDVMLNDAVEAWLDKHKLRPNFWAIEDVKQHKTE